MADRYQLGDLVGFLGMKAEADAKALVNSTATKMGLGGRASWSFDDAVEILNSIAAEPGLNRVLARCAIARLYAGRSKNTAT